MIVPITAGSSAAAVNLRGTPADASFGLMTTGADTSQPRQRNPKGHRRTAAW